MLSAESVINGKIVSEIFGCIGGAGETDTATRLYGERIYLISQKDLKSLSTRDDIPEMELLAEKIENGTFKIVTTDVANVTTDATTDATTDVSTDRKILALYVFTPELLPQSSHILCLRSVVPKKDITFPYPEGMVAPGKQINISGHGRAYRAYDFGRVDKAHDCAHPHMTFTEALRNLRCLHLSGYAHGDLKSSFYMNKIAVNALYSLYNIDINVVGAITFPLFNLDLSSIRDDKCQLLRVLALADDMALIECFFPDDSAEGRRYRELCLALAGEIIHGRRDLGVYS